jgi:hypothetical protein
MKGACCEKEKKGYRLFLAGTIIVTLMGLTTLIPDPNVSKSCIAGYNAHCSFTPVSTILCFLLAGFYCIRRAKKYTEEFTE